jgi:dTDP-4-amino-4,6-dideoxygalactose transaminase
VTTPAAVPFFEPWIGEAEVAGVRVALESRWLANGPRAASFEERLITVIGAPAAVAVSSGTSGLLLALRALGIGVGDEVITTPVTCIASVNAIVAAGATPVLADVCADTLNLDPERAAEAVTGRTAAIMPVHYAGHPADADAFAAIAARHNLAVIDDAAHALGAVYDGRPVGSLADLTVFSFSATKIITTGEGGLVAGRPDLVAGARLFATLGADRRAADPTPARPSSWADVVVPGLKLAMCDVAASIGLAQLDRLAENLARRREIAQRYSLLLGGVPGLQTAVVRPGMEPAWHLYTLRIDPEVLGESRDDFLTRLVAAGGVAAKQFKPAHHEPYLRKSLGEPADRLPVAERESRRNLSLPLYPGMTDGQVDTVASAVLRAVEAGPAL